MKDFVFEKRSNSHSKLCLQKIEFLCEICVQNFFLLRLNSQMKFGLQNASFIISRTFLQIKFHLKEICLQNISSD